MRVADLIRGDDTDLVRVIISDEASRPDAPSKREGVTVRRGALLRLLRDRPEEVGWVWDVSDEAAWKRLQGEDLKFAYVVCLRPAVAAYDNKVGLRLGVSGSVESPDRQEPPRPGHRPIRLESWANHARAVARVAANRLEKEGGDRSLLQLGFEKRYSFGPGAIAEAVRACALLHDLGKLQDSWQQWAEAAQKARDPRYQHKTLLAHTDFDPENPEDREQERALGLRRPPHAAAGAYYGVPLAAVLLEGHVTPDVRDRLASACAAAILAHHGGWIPSPQRTGQDLGISRLHPGSREALAESVGKELNIGVLGKLESQDDRRRFMERWLEPTTAADNFGAWWPVAAYLTRTLRLSDQRATSEVGTDE